MALNLFGQTPQGMVIDPYASYYAALGLSAPLSTGQVSSLTSPFANYAKGTPLTSADMEKWNAYTAALMGQAQPISSTMWNPNPQSTQPSGATPGVVQTPLTDQEKQQVQGLMQNGQWRINPANIGNISPEQIRKMLARSGVAGGGTGTPYQPGSPDQGAGGGEGGQTGYLKRYAQLLAQQQKPGR